MDKGDSLVAKGKILILLLAAAQPTAAFGEEKVWQNRLRNEIEKIESGNTRKQSFGLFVRDLESGREFSYGGDRTWYLASGVKVAIACAVLREIESGKLELDEKLKFRYEQRIDGSGETNSRQNGSLLSIEYLLRQMLVFSDNTASDILIKKVGIENVNRCVRPYGFSEITSLADVRRHAFSSFHPKAWNLKNSSLFRLGQIRDEKKKVLVLSRFIGIPYSKFKVKTLQEAFSSYYERELNSASLRAYSEFLSDIVLGRVLSPKSTKLLLDIMKDAKTGSRRLIAGFPKHTIFAHKTGTQLRRICDLGILWRARTRPVVITTCTRGYSSNAKAEDLLRRVGKAVANSGILK